MVLEECKYLVKEKQASYYIFDELEIFSDDSDKEIFDVELMFILPIHSTF